MANTQNWYIMRFMQKKYHHIMKYRVCESILLWTVFDKNYVNFNFQNLKNKFYKVWNFTAPTAPTAPNSTETQKSSVSVEFFCFFNCTWNCTYCTNHQTQLRYRNLRCQWVLFFLNCTWTAPEFYKKLR